MTKITGAVSKRKYEIIIFVSLCMSLLVFLGKSELISDRFFGALTFDTHFGIHSLTLIGQLIRIVFGRHPSRAAVVAFQCCALIFSYALTALYCGGALRRSGTKYKNELCCLLVLVAGIHIGFSDYAELFCLFDVYWLIGVMLSLFCAENQYSRFAVPLFAATSLWAHNGFIFTFMPIIYIMCIYHFVRKKTKAGAVQLLFGLVVTVAAAVWFLTSSRFVADVSGAEISAYLKEKTGLSGGEVGIYIMQHFSDNSGSGLYDMDSFYESVNNNYNPFTALLGYFYIAFQIIPVYQLFIYLLMGAPFIVFFSAVWVRAMKSAEKKGEKFVFLLCLLTPIVSFIALLTSSDSSRMTAQAIIEQTLLLFMFVNSGDQNTETALGEVFGKVKKLFPVIACLGAVYAAMLFRW